MGMDAQASEFLVRRALSYWFLVADDASTCPASLYMHICIYIYIYMVTPPPPMI